MPGVVCTPHLGASTEEAQTQVAIEAVELLTAYLTTGAIRHAVNVASLDPKTLASLRGYLDVAYRLGLLLAGLQPGGLKKCRLLYRGELADKDTKVLTAVFAAGLLQNALDEDVNLVNAEVLLKQRGINLVEESRTEMGSFRSSMTAEITAENAQHRAVGTVFGQDMPRLVSLDDYRLEAYLDGCLLVFSHDDVPGIIGSVGTVFGQHHVNIAQMAVGRAKPGGQAVGDSESRRRAAGGRPGGGPQPPGHHLRHRDPAAAGRRIASLDSELARPEQSFRTASSAFLTRPSRASGR